MSTIISSSSGNNNSSAPKSGTYQRSAGAAPPDAHVIEEGYARILFSKGNEVFYNKAQVVNRDLSTLVIKMFEQQRAREHCAQKKPPSGLRILEALSATGLRAVRYWKEIEGIEQIVANDLSPDAVSAIRTNLQFNNVPLEHVVPNQGDANDVMLAHRSNEKQFDIVDLDPYGTASIFMDAAIQCVREGGLLCVTCTDLGVLAGSNPGTCFAKYGAVPVPMKACHEQALRIVLGTLQQYANRHKKYIVPLISCHIDFYVRIFVRVFTSAKEVKQSFAKFGHLYQCTQCDHYELKPIGKVNQNQSHHPAQVGVDSHCSECAGAFKIGGPLWIDRIHQQDFVQQCLRYLKDNTSRFKSEKFLTGLLTVVATEIPDAPLFYEHSNIASKFKMTCPPISMVRSAILNAGFQVSQSHCDPQSIKTNAPINALHDVYRAWHEENVRKPREDEEQEMTKQTRDQRLKEKNPEHQKSKKQLFKENKNVLANILLSKPASIKVDFTERSDAKGVNVPAFLPHPEANWGPKSKAKPKRVRDDNAPSENSTTRSADEEPNIKQKKVQ